MEKTYFLIEIEGRNNVGVIGIDIPNINHIDEDNIKLIDEAIRPKLIVAIESHYDSSVEIISVKHETYYPNLIVSVTLEQDNEDVVLGEDFIITTIVLTKTWVY